MHSFPPHFSCYSGVEKHAIMHSYNGESLLCLGNPFTQVIWIELRQRLYNSVPPLTDCRQTLTVPFNVASLSIIYRNFRTSASLNNTAQEVSTCSCVQRKLEHHLPCLLSLLMRERTLPLVSSGMIFLSLYFNRLLK